MQVYILVLYCYIYEVSLDTQQYLSNNNLNKQKCYAGNNRRPYFQLSRNNVNKL
jgi:hypothetical protein